MLLQNLKKLPVFKDSKFEEAATKILIRCKDRSITQNLFEQYLKKSKYKYKILPKATEMEVTGIKQKLIFKPLKAKGVGGLNFEKQFVDDFKDWFNGYDYEELKHGDTLKEVIKVMKWKQSSKNLCEQVGTANTKRPPEISSNKLIVTNNDTGKVADVKFTINNQTIYASLKFSEAFYIYNATVIDYFKSTNPKIRKMINEFFGFDGDKMAKGFGKEYQANTVKKPDYAAISTRLADLINQALGPDVLLVNKVSQDKNFVNYIKGMGHKVTLENLNESCYLYAEKDVRKYCAIKVNAIVNGHKYKIEFQFRGTTAVDVGPRYLRINLKVI
jgi:hypothetical protein